uniref:Si:ch211-247j9.1 n=1 Tax=Poecilia formosa TaxID=48698 RepID=A0A096MEU4_POEFO
MGLSCFKSWKYDSTGHKVNVGNRDVLASPGSYFFLSNSAGQGDEWLKSLNKGVWIPFTAGVFGQRLDETVLYERRYGVRLVPLVVEQCVTFIRERGLHEVGLFRQPGRTSLVKELQEAFDSGERPSFDRFLNEVQSCSSSNKMNVQNLATVFGPNILRAKAEDPQSIMGATKLVQVLMSELIRQHKSLFAKFPPSACSHPSATPLKQPHLQPSPCLRQLSLPLIADHSSESGQPAAHADHSRYHSGQGSSSANAQATTTNPQLQTESSNQGAMGWQRQEKAASASWSCRGAEEEGEVPEAASGGSSQAQEDSTPSVYDNLDRASLSHTLENVPTENFDLDSPGINVGMCETEVDQAELGTAGDSSSSWSSCEVLPLDKSKDELGVSSPDIPPKRSRMLPLNQRREQEICDKDDHEDNTGSSEVFLPSGAPDLQVQESHLESRDTHSLLAKLRQQMAQQKAEYQNRIERLERCNDALERQVAVLRLSLEQQRRSQSVAEIKIRNMERAKADADRRNTTLQREMELFFRTYGEISRSEKGKKEAA